jgi:hypothetical protein
MTTQQIFEAITNAQLRPVQQCDLDGGPTGIEGFAEITGGPLDGLLLYIQVGSDPVTAVSEPMPEFLGVRLASSVELAEAMGRTSSDDGELTF